MLWIWKICWDQLLARLCLLCWISMLLPISVTDKMLRICRLEVRKRLESEDLCSNPITKPVSRHCSRTNKLRVYFLSNDTIILKLDDFHYMLGWIMKIKSQAKRPDAKSIFVRINCLAMRMYTGLHRKPRPVWMWKPEGDHKKKLISLVAISFRTLW